MGTVPKSYFRPMPEGLASTFDLALREKQRRAVQVEALKEEFGTDFAGYQVVAIELHKVEFEGWDPKVAAACIAIRSYDHAYDAFMEDQGGKVQSFDRFEDMALMLDNYRTSRPAIDGEQ